MSRTLSRHRLLVVLALGAALVAGWQAWQRLRGPRVQVIEPHRAPLVQTVVASGRVRPERLQLAPLVTGRVIAIPAVEGQHVETGERLLQLDDQEASVQLAEAQAGLARVRAQQHSVGSLQLGQVREQLAQAEARAEEARDDLRRIEGLARRGAVAAVTLEQAKIAVRVSESALRDARLQLTSLSKGGVQVRGAQAAVQQAEAHLALARARLDYHCISAPVAGVIIALETRVGDVVQVGEPAIEIAAAGRTELVVELDERNLALLQVGQLALASAEAYPELRFAARVGFIAPAVDAARGTVEVRLVVHEPPEYLRPDMTVSIEVEVARKGSALTLPAGAVRDLATDPHVLTWRDGVARRQAVEVGIRDELRVEVLGGVSEDTKVITTAGVQPGQRVRAKGGQP